MKTLKFGLLGALFVLFQTGCLENNPLSASSLPAPTVSLNNMPQMIQGNHTLIVQFDAQAADGKSINNLNFQYAPDGVTFSSVGILSGASTSYNWQVPAVDLSTAKIKLTAQDNRGFTTDQVSNVFSILSTPPQITVTSNQVINNQNSATFTGTCKPGDTIQYFGGLAPGQSQAVQDHYNRIHAPTCTTSGTWSLQIQETTLSQVFSYTLVQSDPVGNSTSVAFTWTRSTLGPVISGLTLNDCTSDCTTSNHIIKVSVKASDAFSPVQYACFKWSLDGTIAPPAPFVAGATNDPCWNTLQTWSNGNVSASNQVQFKDIPYSIGFFIGTYPVYAWFQDGLGNVSSLATSSIFFNPAHPPVIGNIVAANTNLPATSITTAEMTVPQGSPVFIKWNIVDGNLDAGGNPVPVPAQSISLYYTTDESTYTLIASNLSNTANGSCSIAYNNSGSPGLPMETGCYAWQSGSPTNGYLKIRVVITNSKGMTSYAASGALNTGSLRWLAGNTDLGLGGSGSAAVLVNRNNGHDDGDHHSLAVTNDGTVFFRDNTRGVLRIDPVTGVIQTYLPRTGTYSGEGKATVPPVASSAQPNVWTGITLHSADLITLDYQDNLLVWDANRIIQVNHQTGVVHTLVGGGTSRADTIPALTLGIDTPTSQNGHLFQALPNGDIVFQGDGGGSVSYGADPKLRQYHASGSLAGQITTLHFSGNGADGNPTRDLLNDPCGVNDNPVDFLDNFAVLFNPLTSVITAVNAMVFTNSSPISDSCQAGVSFDPQTGINLGAGPDIPLPHGTSAYSDSSRFNARNGDLYSVERFESVMQKYNPTTNTWQVILGGAGRGHCADGSPAVGCPVQLKDAYVTTSNEVFFVDDGMIRVIYNDEATGVNRVQTLYGQSGAYGDGGLALSARFSDIPWLDMTASGLIAIADDQENKIREFPTSSSVVPLINTIAGNGIVAEVTDGITALTSPLAMSENFGPESMLNVPGSDDLLISQEGNGIYRYGATDGKWHLFFSSRASSSRAWWVNQDGMKASATYGAQRRVDVLGMASSSSPEQNTLMIAGYSTDSGSDNANSYAKTYTSTDGFVTGTQGALAGNSSIMSSTFSANGAPTASSNIPFSQNMIRSSFDSVTGDWLSAYTNTSRVVILNASGNVASYTLPRNILSFTYVSASDSTPSAPHGTIYYCGYGPTWELYKYDTVSAKETIEPWPSTTVQCAGKALIWNPSQNTLIFAIQQNELSGVGEYSNP